MNQDRDDIVRIRVTDCDVGITGLKQVFQEMAESHADMSEAEIELALLERLSVRNYIANSARAEYGKAFVREFRKFLGQPYEEESGGAISVLVVGPGCAECNRLEQYVMVALNDLGLPASLEHVTDMNKVSKFGYVATPGLIIDGKIVSGGKVPPIDKIRDWLKEASQKATD
ncbi:MAG: thioredoxin family protein [Desulfomonilaceae bacterium]